MLRDKQRCTFKSRSGRKCNSTHNLQIDHIKPFAVGGTHDPGNLRVLCAAHNRHEARRVFDELSLPAPELAEGQISALAEGQTSAVAESQNPALTATGNSQRAS